MNAEDLPLPRGVRPDNSMCAVNHGASGVLMHYSVVGEAAWLPVSGGGRARGCDRNCAKRGSSVVVLGR